MSFTIHNHSDLLNQYHLNLPEGLFWHNDSQELFFVDITSGRLFTASTLPLNIVNTFSIGCSVGHVYPVHSTGKYVVAADNKLVLTSSLSHVDEHSLFEICESKVRTHRFNDGLLVNDSEFWFGLMSVSQPDLSASGSLVAVDKSGCICFSDNDYIIPNGPIINATGCLLIHNDSYRRHIYSYDYDGLSTQAHTRKLRLDLSYQSGQPDGMTLDKMGNVLIAMYGASHILVIDNKFNSLFTIDIDYEFPTNVCFAGPNKEQLFVTYASSRDDQMNGGLLEILDYYALFS